MPTNQRPLPWSVVRCARAQESQARFCPPELRQGVGRLVHSELQQRAQCNNRGPENPKEEATYSAWAGGDIGFTGEVRLTRALEDSWLCLVAEAPSP